MGGLVKKRTVIVILQALSCITFAAMAILFAGDAIEKPLDVHMNYWTIFWPTIVAVVSAVLSVCHAVMVWMALRGKQS